MARAFATSPGLLLLDEPLSALDRTRAGAAQGQEIRILQQSLGVTTIMVTHDQEEALSVADRIVVMNQGAIEQIGTPLQVYREPAHAVRRRFRRQGQRAAARVAGGRPCASAPPASTAAPTTAGAPSDVPAPGGHRSRGRSRRRRQCLRRADRQDRVPRLVLPGAGDRRRRWTSQPLTVYLSLNFLAEQRLEVGSRLQLRVLPERMRVFDVAHDVSPSAARRAACASARTGPTGSRTWRCCVVALALVVFLAAAAARRSCAERAGQATARFVGLANFVAYFEHAGAAQSLWNSVWVSALVTRDHGAAAFVLRLRADAQLHAGQRRCFAGITLIPLLAPSLLSAISFIYWFGNQGVLKDWMRRSASRDLRRARHRAVAECFAVFPHALMILVTALSLADARLYEAADSLGTQRARASSSPSRCPAPSTG